MPPRFPRSRWKAGTVYALPLFDNTFGFGQAVTAMWPTLIYVALFSYHLPAVPKITPQLLRRDVVALVATWRQHLNGGRFATVGVAKPVVEKHEFPNERFAEAGYIGARHYDSGLLCDLLSAYFAITPWNVMYDEDCWDTMLAPGISRPDNAIILSPRDRERYRATLIQNQKET